MKVCAAAVSAVLIAGCAATCPRGNAPSIVGTWELKPIATDTLSLNPGCYSSVEYRSDGTFLTRNGDMEIIGRYELGSENGALYYCESDLRGNGGKSCQGFTSDFVIRNSRPKRSAILEGDVLKLYSSSQSYFVLQRRR
jgi:hypothetical protein